MNLNKLQQEVINNYDKLLYQTSIEDIKLFEEADDWISIYFSGKWVFRTKYTNEKDLISIIKQFVDYGKEQFSSGYHTKQQEIREVLGIKD